MSKEMREQIDRVKNFDKFINENENRQIDINVGEFVEITSGKRGIGVVYQIRDESIYVDLGGVSGSFPVVVKQGQFIKIPFYELPKDKYLDFIVQLQTIIFNKK